MSSVTYEVIVQFEDCQCTTEFDDLAKAQERYKYNVRRYVACAPHVRPNRIILRKVTEKGGSVNAGWLWVKELS